jgi:serine/threonine protein kinase
VINHYIVCRDIKGGNILVDDTGTVKLADFGASIKMAFNETQETTTIKGTPYFMAPEVLSESKYGRRGDIWAVGCTIIQMLTGNPPWKDRNLQSIIQLHMLLSTWEGIPPISVDIPPVLDAFLELCFAKNPMNRPMAARLLKEPFLEYEILYYFVLYCIDFMFCSEEELSESIGTGGCDIREELERATRSSMGIRTNSDDFSPATNSPSSGSERAYLPRSQPDSRVSTDNPFGRKSAPVNPFLKPNISPSNHNYNSQNVGAGIASAGGRRVNHKEKKNDDDVGYRPQSVPITKSTNNVPMQQNSPRDSDEITPRRMISNGASDNQMRGKYDQNSQPKSKYVTSPSSKSDDDDFDDSYKSYASSKEADVEEEDYEYWKCLKCSFSNPDNIDYCENCAVVRGATGGRGDDKIVPVRKY